MDTAGVPFVGAEGASTLKDGDYACVLHVIRVVREQPPVMEDLETKRRSLFIETMLEDVDKIRLRCIVIGAPV